MELFGKIKVGDSGAQAISRENIYRSPKIAYILFFATLRDVVQKNVLPISMYFFKKRFDFKLLKKYDIKIKNEKIKRGLHSLPWCDVRWSCVFHVFHAKKCLFILFESIYSATNTTENILSSSILSWRALCSIWSFLTKILFLSIWKPYFLHLYCSICRGCREILIRETWRECQVRFFYY